MCVSLFARKDTEILIFIFVDKILRASQTKDKLADFKDDFLLAKEELKTYFEVCHIKLSSAISDKVDQASSKLDEILSRLSQPAAIPGVSPEFWDYVKANGGEQAVINVSCLFFCFLIRAGAESLRFRMIIC